MRMTEVERIRVVVITDNYYDALRPDPPYGARYRTAPGSSIHAEHGLSYYVETVVDGFSTEFMFDFGLDGKGVLNNMALLKIDFERIAAFGLSHGHFDHWGGLLDHQREGPTGVRNPSTCL
jgi:7,8-dihydropterin-6-yl-methyl-4-(beta-D-ribofuranosyl)aminobenzene 5'-phosphate synthase